eukprot:756410-Alexandrium_andersonii.AAC.1
MARRLTLRDILQHNPGCDRGLMKATGAPRAPRRNCAASARNLVRRLSGATAGSATATAMRPTNPAW